MHKIAREELSGVVEELLASLPHKKKGATVLALSGDLGAGKTTFVQELGRHLGIDETIQSPTYVLMKTYPISYGQFTLFIHIDAYRLDTPEEFKTLKPDTFLNNKEHLVCIEWPEKAAGVLPTPDLIINFSADGAAEGERYIGVNHG